MKFLLDMPISQSIAAWLRSQGFDTVHVRDIRMAKASDPDILDRAAAEERILLTMDLGIPTILAFRKTHQPGIILFRMRRPLLSLMQSQLELLFRLHSDKLLTQSVAIIEDARIRLRKLPIS